MPPGQAFRCLAVGGLVWSVVQGVVLQDTIHKPLRSWDAQGLVWQDDVAHVIAGLSAPLAIEPKGREAFAGLPAVVIVVDGVPHDESATIDGDRFP